MKTDTARIAQHRDSNLELYRIILMLAIIAHHYVINSALISACINKKLIY